MKDLQLGAYVRKALPLQASWASPDLAENKWMLTGKGADPFDAFLIKANNPERVIHYVISSGITDYDDERMSISKKAPRLKNYNRHRACLFAHIYYEPVIGNIIRMRKDIKTEMLHAWLEYLPREVYEWADQLFRIVRHTQSDGTSAMPNGSIGFKYYAGEPGSMEDEGYIFKYTDWELLEFSPCPVGSNPDAHGYLPTDPGGQKKFWAGYSPGSWPTKLIINPSEPDYRKVMKSIPIIGQKQPDEEAIDQAPDEADGEAQGEPEPSTDETEKSANERLLAVCERIENVTDALKHFMGVEIIPRLERIEKQEGRSGGNRITIEEKGSPKPGASDEAGADVEQVKAVHRRVANLYGSGKTTKPNAEQSDLAVTFKTALPHTDKEGDKSG